MNNILIIGLGSIAMKHIEILKEINGSFSFFALRSKPKSTNVKGIKNLYNFRDVKKIKFLFVIISSPSFRHYKDIIKFSKLKVPLFVEKPLCVNSYQLNKIKKMRFRYPVYNALNLRFHPLLNFIKKYLNQKNKKIYEINCYFGSFLPSWRNNKNYKKNYSVSKKMGGGVHLDLIHEPDYIHYLFGSPISTNKRYRKISSLEGDSFDTATINMHYKYFSVNIVLNYFRKDSKRQMEIVNEDCTLRLDFLENNIKNLSNGRVLFEDHQSMKKSYENQMVSFLSSIKSGESSFKFKNLESLSFVL